MPPALRPGNAPLQHPSGIGVDVGCAPLRSRLTESGPERAANPEKAASGVHLHKLAPHPETSAVVRRIFDLYVNSGLGFKAIARVLDGERVPSPSAHDPARNPHRPGHAWASSAVRAILSNPRYLGRHMFGRQRRQELLIDPLQPALGHETRMQWQSEDSWLVAEEQTHPALVDDETWRCAQLLMAQRGRQKGGGGPRSDVGRYVLAGLIRCKRCGRRMQGSHTRGHFMYRCRLIGGDYARAPADHPKTMAVREDRILPVLDEWLVGLFAPEHLEALAERIVEADHAANHGSPSADQARRTIAEARRKIHRHMAALEAGVDPDLIAERTRKAPAEIAAAQAILNAAPGAPPPPLTVDEVVDTLRALHNVPRLLQAADPAIRAEIYRSLGITLTYRRDDNDELVQVHAQIGGVDLERVGGGT